MSAIGRGSGVLRRVRVDIGRHLGCLFVGLSEHMADVEASR